MKILSKDTIAAVATPRGAGGIAIIKISGPDAVFILKRIFRPSAQTATGSQTFHHRRILHGHIFHPQEGVLDEVLVSVMQSPNSYTTEDVVEINCHGGAVVMQEVLDLVLRQGARVAEPGEFTRRAFLGGRINLTQAEAVIDLINAKTRKATRSGLQQLMHGVDKKVQQLHTQLMIDLAEIEAYIDFDDDMDETVSIAPIGERIVKEILPPIQGMIESYREGRLLKEGLRIVIAGRPNVGKSSLANMLLNQERVIVTALPGTTRDVIEEMIAINGTPVIITDTAGIHPSQDPIEAIGIEKTEEAIEQADLVLFIIDSSMPLQPEDRKIYHDLKDRALLVVQNKVDLCEGRPSQPELDHVCEEDLVALSALTGEGHETLKLRITERIGLAGDPADSKVLVNQRQRKLLEASRQHLENAGCLLRRGKDAEIAAYEIKGALSKFMEILGQDVAPDVLDQIFKRFCIGK